MGIIKRQGIKSTIVNYAGAFIGALAVLFVYPLDDEIYGYAQWLYNTAFLFIPLATLGLTSTIVKFFPEFSDKRKGNNNGLLSLILLGLVIVFLLFLLFWNLFNDQVVRLLTSLDMKASLLEENEHYIVILIALLACLSFLTSQSTNMLRIVVPNIIQQFGFKLFLPLLVLAYVYFEFSKETFTYAILGFFGGAVLLLFIYLKFIGGLRFDKIRRPNKDFKFRSIASYSLFGSMNQLSSSLAVRIDSIMIPLFLDMLRNGFYNKTLFITNVIEFPARSLVQIAGPIISKAWDDNDMEELDKVYKKGGANLFLIGCFVFLSIWYVLDDLISISSNPDSFPDARWIFLLIGGSKLFDMLSSVNTQIIIYSKKYKYNLLFLIFLAISNLILNLKLIPIYGILGAAMATSLSLVVYNLIKMIFIYKSFDLQPFTSANFKTFVLFILLAGLFYTIPLNFNPLINIPVKLLALTFIFVPVSYYWKISEDINEMVIDGINRIKIKK